MKTPQKSLKKWGDEDWGYVGKEGSSRYLPKAARDSLTPSQKAAGNRRKRKATAQGKQKAKYTTAERKALLKLIRKK
tara:strand:+ start:400 stop:630 length:231 start_codon:yes stop_codon:yes gene_type:complete